MHRRRMSGPDNFPIRLSAPPLVFRGRVEVRYGDLSAGQARLRGSLCRGCKWPAFLAGVSGYDCAHPKPACDKIHSVWNIRCLAIAVCTDLRRRGSTRPFLVDTQNECATRWHSGIKRPIFIPGSQRVAASNGLDGAPYYVFSSGFLLILQASE